jgi:hypothetical protein
VEDGRFSRPYGPGAHSRNLRKTNLRLRRRSRNSSLDRQHRRRTKVVIAGDPLALLIGLDRPSWERTRRHGEHGDISVEPYETHVAAEEVDHLAQIARLL